MITRADVQKYAVPVEESSLKRLQYWLNYEKYTAILAGAAPWFYYIVILILYLAAIVFTPYMLWHLYKARWNKSIFIFCAVVLLPAVGLQFISPDKMIYNILFTFFPLFNFYVYTWFLNYLIKTRITELNELKKIRKAAEELHG